MKMGFYVVLLDLFCGSMCFVCQVGSNCVMFDF